MALVPSLFAQNEGEDKGTLSSSFETNTTYYFNDEKTGAMAPDMKFGSNNYLKVDYVKGGFSFVLHFQDIFPCLFRVREWPVMTTMLVLTQKDGTLGSAAFSNSSEAALFSELMKTVPWV